MAQALAIRPSAGTGDRPALQQAAGAILGLAGGLLLARRERHPEQTAWFVTAAHVGQVAAQGAVAPIASAVAVFGAARRAAPVRGPLVGAICALVIAAVSAAAGAGVEATYAVALLLSALAGAVSGTRALRTERSRAEAVAQERLRIARELHDIVGHGMAAITVQAGAGRMALASGHDDEASRALAAIEEAGRDVLRQVRWLVALLRDADAPGLGDLPLLVDAARRTGLSVTCDAGAGAEDVESDVQTAVYRVVQEALTNVVRHAGAKAVEISVEISGDDAGSDVRITVTDDGDGSGAERAPAGHGLTGMRERVEALGGVVSAGPRSGGSNGWQVRAVIPTGRERR